MIDFSSRNIENKMPFGAVKTHQKVFINLGIKDGIYALSVKLILRKDDFFKEFDLKYDKQKGDFHYFVTSFEVDTEGCYFYRFQVDTPNGFIHIGHNGDSVGRVGEWLNEWQLTVYNANYNTPEWIKGGVIYHIFVDRFCRVADNRNIKPLKNWVDQVTIIDDDGIYRSNDFYGGNFLGIIEKLPYLKSLGINCIYLSPIFKSYSNHRYDTGDYMTIDELIGDEKTFKLLINKAKLAGIRIILDGVFNHTGSDSKYFNRFNTYDSIGAYQGKKSHYYDWFTFKKDGTYDCWWGCTNVPNIKKDSLSFQNFIMNEVMQKWLDFGIAGYRLDVVDELSLVFVKGIYNKIKTVNKHNLVLGEVWEDASTKVAYNEKKDYLSGEKLDGVMNYPFRNAILRLLNGKNITEFINIVMTIEENYPPCSLQASMTLVGSHDTVRIINELAELPEIETKMDRLNFKMDSATRKLATKKLKIAVLLQYFLTGVPSVYYGDEIGMEGYEDPINRKPFDTQVDADILEHYIYLGNLRKNNKSDFIAPISFKQTENRSLIICRGKFVVTINLADYSFDITEKINLK